MVGTAPSDIRLGRIHFSAEGRALLSQFDDELGAGLVGYACYRPDAILPGRVVVALEVPGSIDAIPLVSMDDSGRYFFSLDADATCSFVRQEQYRRTRVPFYVKLGLSPDEFPRVIRKAALAGFKLSRTFLKSLATPRLDFPELYKDLSVDIWLFFIHRIVEQAIGADATTTPLWPHNKRYAITLNHDIDTDWGIRNSLGVEAFRGPEEELGFTSAWLAVGNLQDAGRECFNDLRRSGHEIGCHGTVHDHSIAYMDAEEVRKRLDSVQRFLEEFECRGFRSPSYHHSASLYAGLDGVLDYDLSMHDCIENPNSPVARREGCSTCFPFRIVNTRVLEIPTTVPEDFVMEMNGYSPSEVLSFQIETVRAIGKRQGVASILTHPEPRLSSRAAWIDCYRELLKEVAGETDAWVALPGEISDWWNKREQEIVRMWSDE
jgi:peptidoglycan/xylan/chitin deacetylase (PgdA/CDA1 family)